MEHSASDSFTIFNGVMDLILLLTSFWMAYTARKMSLGGAVGKTVNMVVFGAIVLGLAHLIETVLSYVFPEMPVPQGELIHRAIILVGFILLTVGLSSLATSLGKMRK
jgi:DMSO/TMAO reductase YedYZ heme-binding membrane subunit